MKTCSICLIEKNINDFGLSSKYSDGLNYLCKECNSKKQKKYRDKYKEKIKEKKASYKENNREKVLTQKLSSYYKNEDRNKEVRKIRQRRNKEELIKEYGGKCVCCGESTYEFLTIDHINGEGSKHRSSLTTHFYRWLKINNFPKEGYQLLCMNCNFAKGKYGSCPHIIGV